MDISLPIFIAVLHQMYVFNLLLVHTILKFGFTIVGLDLCYGPSEGHNFLEQLLRALLFSAFWAPWPAAPTRRTYNFRKCKQK